MINYCNVIKYRLFKIVLTVDTNTAIDDAFLRSIASTLLPLRHVLSRASMAKYFPGVPKQVAFALIDDDTSKHQMTFDCRNLDLRAQFNTDSNFILIHDALHQYEGKMVIAIPRQAEFYAYGRRSSSGHRENVVVFKTENNLSTSVRYIHRILNSTTTEQPSQDSFCCVQ